MALVKNSFAKDDTRTVSNSSSSDETMQRYALVALTAVCFYLATLVLLMLVYVAILGCTSRRDKKDEKWPKTPRAYVTEYEKEPNRYIPDKESSSESPPMQFDEPPTRVWPTFTTQQDQEPPKVIDQENVTLTDHLPTEATHEPERPVPIPVEATVHQANPVPIPVEATVHQPNPVPIPDEATVHQEPINRNSPQDDVTAPNDVRKEKVIHRIKTLSKTPIYKTKYDTINKAGNKVQVKDMVQRTKAVISPETVADDDDDDDDFEGDQVYRSRNSFTFNPNGQTSSNGSQALSNKLPDPSADYITLNSNALTKPESTFQQQSNNDDELETKSVLSTPTVGIDNTESHNGYDGEEEPDITSGRSVTSVIDPNQKSTINSSIDSNLGSMTDGMKSVTSGLKQDSNVLSQTGSGLESGLTTYNNVSNENSVTSRLPDNQFPGSAITPNDVQKNKSHELQEKLKAILSDKNSKKKKK